MTINFTSKTIEMTKAESKAAGKFGSEAYKELTTIMQQFPTFTIQVIARTSVKKSSEFKGLTYSYTLPFKRFVMTSNMLIPLDDNSLRDNPDSVLSCSMCYGPLAFEVQTHFHHTP